MAAAPHEAYCALLPRRKRTAIITVCAFARRVEEIGESSQGEAEKLRQLDLAQRSLQSLREDATSRDRDSDPLMAALADAVVGFDLPLQALEDLIAGVRMDVSSGGYESFEDLLLYCRRTAGALGRLCVAILGSRDARAAAQFAEDLGVAMALAGIVRDLRADAQRGRVYLPRGELVRYHLHDGGALDAPALEALAFEGMSAAPEVIAGFDGGDVGQLYALMRFQVLRARDWFHRAAPLVLLLDRRGSDYVMAMSGAHRRLLKHIEKRPDQALALRASLSPREQAWVLTRALLGRRRVPEQHPAERML